MKNKKQIGFTILLIILPIALGLVFWNRLPEEIPMHWNYKGEVDQYVSKKLWLFITPLISVLIYASFGAIPKIDPRKNHELHYRSLETFRVITLLFLFAAFVFQLLYVLGYINSLLNAIIYAVVVLLIVTGNFLGKLRPSFLVGIRTPWTLSSEEVWRKTHRFAAGFIVYFSIFTLVLLLLADQNILMVLFFIYLGVIVLLPVLYSLYLYSKIPKHDPTKLL